MKILSEERALELTEKLLRNDKEIKESIPNTENFATKSFVTSEIAKAELSGGEVDLSNYINKETFDKTIDNYSTTDEIKKMVDEKFAELDGDKLDANFETSNIDFSIEY